MRIRPLEGEDTEPKFIGKGHCNNCKQDVDDLYEYSYLTWTRLGPDYATPDKWETVKACNECLIEDIMF